MELRDLVQAWKQSGASAESIDHPAGSIRARTHSILASRIAALVGILDNESDGTTLTTTMTPSISTTVWPTTF
jgi:hypothetical protein